MKGIILAGGTGSRLYPLTQAMNKHLLPVGRYPMIIHAINKLKRANIEEILLVSGREHLGSMIHLLGSGQEWGISLTYKVQDQPAGIAQALGLAESFANGKPITVILGDNVFSDDILPYVMNFRNQAKGAKVLLKEVKDPERYGVAMITGNKIVSIEEKPHKPKSRYAVTGIYMYDNQVFDIIKTIKPSGRGELEITDVNHAYLERGQLTFDFLHGWWIDAGTHDSFFLANQLAKDLELD